MLFPYRLYHLILGVSLYGYGCGDSGHQAELGDWFNTDGMNLAQCKVDCLENPYCISVDAKANRNGTYQCRKNSGTGNFGVGCDLNLDPEKRKCYKRDRSSKPIINNFCF